MSGWGRETLPYGVVRTPDGRTRVGVAVDDGVLDLAPQDADLFDQPSLHALLAAGPDVWAEWRGRVRELVAGDPPLLQDAQPVLPFTVADYVDFYASEVHASTVGRIFRPDGPPLHPAWKHLPVGYHGRAGSVVVSGTDVVRPRGLTLPGPTLRPTQELDVEVELGFVVGTPSVPGVPVPVEALEQHVFGVVLVNDWSARDVQRYEYVPLGPFLGKSFATSVSAWVVPLDGLDRVAAPPQEPAVAPHLHDDRSWGLDVRFSLQVNGSEVSRPPMASTYWTPGQLLAHLTSNGAAVRTGDLFASGTVSGPEPDERGCLLELTWGGRDGLPALGGASWLRDGDEVVITATTGDRPLGEVRARVLPAR